VEVVFIIPSGGHIEEAPGKQTDSIGPGSICPLDLPTHQTLQQ